MIEFTLLAVLIVGSLLYLYLNNVYSYWTKKGLPQPPVTYLFGNILDVFIARNSLGAVYTHIYRSYPNNDAVGVYGCLTPYLMVRTPELIQKVLVSDFSSFHDNEFTVNKELDPHFYMDPFCLKGEAWKSSRSKLMPTMSAARVKEIFPLMKEVVPRMDGYINEHLEKDIDAKELVTLFTMDNVSSTVFGINSNCFSDPEAAFRKIGDLQMKEVLQTWWKTMTFILLPKVRDFVRLRFVPTVVVEYIEKLVQEVLNFRKQNNVTRNDLFQQFMKKDPEGGTNELMFYAITFFLEGFESSSMVASRTLYELAINPQIQQVLYEEIKEAINDKSDLSYDVLNNLPYLDKVLKEAMRKYPILFAMTRECTKPISLDIDGNAIKVEVGTPVIVPVFAIHSDPQYYPDPDVFDPERFSEEIQMTRPQYTYMPFGEGPRICPGMKFALAQVKLLIASIVYKYRIVRTKNTPTKLTFQIKSFLVVPNETELIGLQKRTHQ